MNDMATRFGSGREVQRIEDPALVQGLGRYTDDFAPAGCTHLAFLRSPVAHARIVSIDVSAALALPGVLAVLTGADLVAAGVKPLPFGGPFKRPDGTPMAAPVKRALAHEVVRHVGEAVAIVIAETREQARDAINAVMVEYDELPAVTDPLAATAAGAPVVCEAAPDNVCAIARHGNAAATEAAFAQARHVVALDLNNQRLAASPMEPRTVLVAPVGARLEVRLSSQMPTAVRGGIASLIPGLRTDDVRVVVGDVGGGFGMKTGLYPEDVAVAYAAKTLQRPVKWRAERLEEFLSSMHGRDLGSRAELALDDSGRVLALRVRSWANVGAYPGTPAVAIQLMIGPWVATGVYDIPLIDFEISAVLTHTAATGPYRGAGRPEAIYNIERLMDAAARATGIDPAELRRRNMVRPEQMPYKNAMGQTYDSGHFESMLDQGLAMADWAGYAARHAESAARGKLRGRSVTTFLEWTSGNAFEETATVDVHADGSIEIFTATQAMGQGIATSYAQLAVDVFDVPIDRIRIVQGDTDRGNGFGSAGSRSLFTGGTALQQASRDTLDKARELAAESLEAPAADLEYRGGRFNVAGTDLSVDLATLAGKLPDARLRVAATTSVSGPSWPNACHVCEVEIDPATGEVQIVAYSGMNDIGRIVSPTIVRGQVEGGAVQGIGQALCEQVVYDESGQLLSASFMDYALPRADGFIGFKTAFDTRVPAKTNPLGVKGVGELGTIGATPAVINAVVDALVRAGAGERVAQLQMPATSERVWRVLHGA